MTADDSRHASSRSARLPLPDHAVHHVGRNHSRRPGRRQLAVLEGAGLRSDTDLLEVGCGVGRLVYDKLTDIPDQIYGQGIGSHYQAQGLKLSKHFKQD